LFESEAEDISSRECQVETDFEMLIPSDFVTNIAERLSLYTELANVKNESELMQFSSGLADRFGKLPQSVLKLIDTVRLKWAGKRLGLEKITLNNGQMRMYFPGDSAALVYSSNAFARMMQHVANSPNKFSMKQTDKALITQVRGVESVFEAMAVLADFEAAGN